MDEVFASLLEDNLNEVQRKAETKKTDTLLAVLDAIGDTNTQPVPIFRDKFTVLMEYVLETRTEIERVLESYFPGRWEIQQISHLNTSSTDAIKTHLDRVSVTDIEDKNVLVTRFIAQNGYNNLHSIGKYRAYIHFPEITITNSRRQTHLIRDLWMKFDFNFLGRSLGHSGMRTTKTYAEYASSYNHSHMQNSASCDSGTSLGCCLGNTDYSTLSAQLTHKFDSNMLSLFMQQLPDYLAWESLEGGPYARIENISAKNYNGSRTYLGGTQLENAYKTFLRTYPSGYNIQLIDNGAHYQFKVIKDEEFKARITNICPEEFKQSYDIIAKKQFIDTSNSISSQEIARLNSDFERRPMFTYKGNPVYFKIYNPNAVLKTDNPNIVRIAPDQMIDYIAQQIELNVNKYYIEEYSKELMNRK